MATLGATLTTATYPDASTGASVALISSVTVTSSISGVTFSGLDGNTHEVYMLQGRIVEDGGATHLLFIQPNGVVSGTGLLIRYDGISVTTQTETALAIGQVFPNETMNFTAVFHAKSTANSRNIRRSAHSFGGGDQEGWNAVGQWDDQVGTNLISMVISTEFASGIGNGSELSLYRVLRA